MNIQEELINWYKENKRVLPFRDIDDPYKIWVSEIMLQQTTVTAVIPGSLTVVSNFLLTKSLKTLIISMLLSFFIVKFVKINVLIWANVCYNRHRR